MKILLFLFIIMMPLTLKATDYYISSAGHDVNNNGLAPSAPWKTIAKVNSIFSTLKPGDRILFNRGDIFYGSLKVSKSGLISSPIIIGAYGTGEKPIISGFATIAIWNNEGNGIYSSGLTCESAPEMVIIDGVQYGMGRYPDKTWLTVDTHSGDVSVTDADLNDALIDWTGAEIVQRKPNLYTIDRNIITDHNNNTLYYSGAGNSSPLPGYGYIIQNDLRTLTALGEWFYNPKTSLFYMYFGSSIPNGFVVQVASINDLVTFSIGVKYITFDNLQFKGANHNAVYMSQNNYITIQNCEINFSGFSGIRGYVAEHITIKNNLINNSNDLSIYLNGWYTHYANISENILTNTGLILGIGSCANNSGNGISVIAGDYSKIEKNELYEIGYNGISFTGSNCVVKNNIINRYCLRKEDGGGIYFGGGSAYTNHTINGNIILNGVGSTWGKPASLTTLMAAGIYLDYKTTGGSEISNNTIAYNNWNGIFLHGNQNVKVLDNTVFNSDNCIKFQENAGMGYPSRNISMSGNIFFVKNTVDDPIRLNSTTNDFDQFGTFDNNYFGKPLDNSKPIYPSINYTGTRKSLSDWQSVYKQDLNSNISPISLKDTADIDFYYNATKANKEIALTQPMIDVKGAKYVNSVILLPYTSVILMVDPNPATPVIPVFTGAVVENSTPTILEMSYHINLANIVPAASAFTVQVNGVNRVVNSVAVSNNKVQLTLASAVVFGDVVTVSYTVPATNPLQTAAGDKAESISAKTVTNNCLSPVPGYISSVIENATPSSLEISYNLNLASIIPAVSAFSVLVNSVSRTVTSVSITGSKIKLTLASPVVYGNTITISYTAPATNPIQSVTGGKAENFSNKTVTNNCISPAPVYSSSVIENASPSLLVITFSLSLDNTATPPAAFSVQVNSASRTINSFSIVGGKVQLTLATAVVSGDVVTVSYTTPATNPLKTPAGGIADPFSSKSVTNNCISVFPVYVSSVVENATPSLLEITYDQNLANIVPSTSAFDVKVNSLSRSVSAVAIVADKVRLTLSGAISYGDIITVAYTSPSSNPVQNSTGGKAVSFSAKSVTNNLSSPVPVYSSSVIENSAPAVLEMSYNLNLANIIPAATAFTVKINSSTRNVSTIVISGSKVQLTLSSAVIYGDVVTVSYTTPAVNPLQNTYGGVAASISDKTVTNNCVSPVPVYVSSAIENISPSVLEIIYDLSLANLIPAASAFNVTVNSATRSVSSVSITGSKVLLTLTSPVVYGDIVALTYAAPAANPIQVPSGGSAVSFTAKSVSNNCIPTNPVIVSSVIEDLTPAILEIAFDVNLADIVPPLSAFDVKVNSLSRSISSVSVSGKKVQLNLSYAALYGDQVTISYTVSSVNPLQTLSGGMAAGFSNQPVVNNCTAVIPNYVSSTVDNGAPAIVELTYSLTLANIPPEPSAFDVKVNSVSATISSVSIFGDKIMLTLSDPIVFGDLVTVSYDRPATNPIQTNAGGIAKDLIPQSVNNNCIDNTIPNNAPIILIRNETECFSGFVYELDASESNDPDNDNLTFEWTIPDGIPASANNSSTIRFLSPLIKESVNVEFQLRVNDGKTSQSAIIPINISPYKPELYTVRIAGIEASDYQAGDDPKNVIDGNLNTKWSSDGENQWLMLKMATPLRISHLQLAFLQGQNYESYFDIYASRDNTIWNPILTSISSCNFSGDPQVFDFPLSETGTDYEYIRLVGHGNSKDQLNVVSEFLIFGLLQQDPDSGDSEGTSFILYPNPAQDFVNISIEGPTLEPDRISIIDNTGRIVYEADLAPGIKNIQIPNNFNTGIYIVQLTSGKTIVDALKLIINK